MPHDHTDPDLPNGKQELKIKRFHIQCVVGVALWTLYGRFDSAPVWYRRVLNHSVLLLARSYHSLRILHLEQAIWVPEAHSKESDPCF